MVLSFPGRDTALVRCVLGDMKKLLTCVNTPLHVEIRLLSNIFLNTYFKSLFLSMIIFILFQFLWSCHELEIFFHA